ncbi:MAG: ABC transporter ATP-binding protein [Hungatella sp.]
MNQQTIKQDIKVLKRIWSYYTYKKVQFVIGLIIHSTQALLLNGLLGLVLKLNIEAITRKSLNYVIYGNLLFFGIFIVYTIILCRGIYFWFMGATHANAKLKTELLEKILLSKDKMIDNAGFLTRMISDADKALGGLMNSLVGLVGAVLCGIGSIGVLFVIDYRLSIIALVIGIISMIFQLIFTGSLRKTTKKQTFFTTEENKNFMETFSKMLIVRTLRMESIKENEYKEIIRNFLRQRFVNVKIETSRVGLDTIIQWVSQVVLISFGYLLVSMGQIEFSTIMIVPFMVSPIIRLFSESGKYISEIQTAIIGGERVIEVMDGEIEDINSVVHPLNEAEVAIEISNLDFSYELGKKVFAGLNLVIRKGEKVAVVGESGAGKSTLLKLLLGFELYDKGDAFVFNKSIKSMKPGELYDYFSYISQSNGVLDLSIEDNLKMGNSKAEYRQVEHIIERLGIFQEPYEKSMLKESAMNLSGGQVQKVAIARALIKDSPILLLDEATSAMDWMSENNIYRLLEDKTVIFLTHKINNRELFDRIIRIQDGKAEELLNG